MLLTDKGQEFVCVFVVCLYLPDTHCTTISLALTITVDEGLKQVRNT